jgi:hypothetical protein
VLVLPTLPVMPITLQCGAGAVLPLKRADLLQRARVLSSTT